MSEVQTASKMEVQEQAEKLPQEKELGQGKPKETKEKPTPSTSELNKKIIQKVSSSRRLAWRPRRQTRRKTWWTKRAWQRRADRRRVGKNGNLGVQKSFFMKYFRANFYVHVKNGMYTICSIKFGWSQLQVQKLLHF